MFINNRMDRTVSLIISASCLSILHKRALGSEEEWGTTFYPDVVEGKCQMTCSKKTLIKGTKGKPSKEHSELFGRDMMVAVTPLHDEVITPGASCSANTTITMFAHTHPKKLMRWRVSPPSSGDFVAHLVLGNDTNWRKNKQIVTALLMSKEGLYHYWILPKSLEKYIERIQSLCEEPGEKELLERTGEAPSRVMDIMRVEVMKSLMPGYHALEKLMLNNEAALTKESENGVYDVAIRIAKQNPLLEHLGTLGMGYTFYEHGKFKDGVKLHGAATVSP